MMLDVVPADMATGMALHVICSTSTLINKSQKYTAN